MSGMRVYTSVSSLADTSSTKSPLPRWAISVTRSRACPRIQPSSRRMLRGLNESIDSAQLGVAWRVHRDERLGHLDHLWCEVLHRDALRRGGAAHRCRGFVHKTARPAALAGPLWTIAEGLRVLDGAVLEALLSTTREPPASLTSSLTTQDLRLWALLAAGIETVDIAKRRWCPSGPPSAWSLRPAALASTSLR